MVDPLFPAPPVPFSLPYPAERLRWALDVIGWTQREMGRRLRIGERSARDMASGHRPTQDAVAIWLEQLAAAVLANPLPAGWGRAPRLSAGAVAVARGEPDRVRPGR